MKAGGNILGNLSKTVAAVATSAASAPHDAPAASSASVRASVRPLLQARGSGRETFHSAAPQFSISLSSVIERRLLSRGRERGGRLHSSAMVFAGH